MEDTRLGTILLESRIIREEDLERCLEIQALGGSQRPLGEILVEQRLIDSSTLDNLLRVQETRRKRALGSISLPGTAAGRYLEAAVEAGANELHLSEGRQPLARVAGELRTLEDERLAGPEVWQFVREQVGPQTLEIVAERNSLTCEFEHPGLTRGRITAFRHSDGIGVTVRLHRSAVRGLEELGIADVVAEPLTSGKGMILLTGERGNGITETFATLLHAAAEHGNRQIVVLDDCLEYPEPSGGARVCMRRVGEHTADYRTGLRAALRSEPDVIFVGDASDPATFNLALLAAESGRLVVAVVHAASTTAVLKRVVSFYPSYVQARVRSILASVARCAVAVRLVPAVEHDRCLLATEVLRFDESVREIVRTGAIEKLKLLLRLDDHHHGYPLDASLLALVAAGQASLEDVFPFAQDKAMFLRAVESSGKVAAHG